MRGAPFPDLYDDLGGLDAHVSGGIVPVTNAQEGAPEPLDQPPHPFLSGLQVLLQPSSAPACEPPDRIPAFLPTVPFMVQLPADADYHVPLNVYINGN